MNYSIQHIDLINKNRIDAAIINANDDLSIMSAKIAEELNIINPILIGNKEIILSLASSINWKVREDRVVHSKSEVESSQIACDLASSGKIKVLVKGHMHTDVLMGEYIKSIYSLRIKGERLSHIWFMSFDNDRKPIIISDGALNIKPNLQTKKSILINVLNFVKKIKTFEPHISILSATEEILPQMESSTEAKELMDWAKLNISGDLKIYGPLAFDNSISIEAANIKGIKNQVAGNANIILVPNIETGNALVKIMVNFMDAVAGGFITGGKVPVVISSRSDNVDSRLSSLSNAILSLRD